MSIKTVSGREVRLVASQKTIDDFKGSIDVGEVLRGRIVELFPEDKVLVWFKGFNLIAETLLPFKKGDIFYAQVGAKEPKISVKILLPRDHQGFTDEDARETIRQLGHTPTPERIKIMKGLIRHNLAVTKETLDGIERSLSLLDGDTDENITALIFMKTHGIKISSRNVELIKLHLFNRLNIVGALKELGDALAGMELEGKKRLIDLIEGMTIRLDEGKVGEQIKDFIRSIGIGYENEIATLDPNTGERRERPRDGLKREKNLKKELLRLLSIIKRLDGESVDTNRTRLQETIHRVLKEIFSVQLTGCQEKESPYLYLQLPVLTDGQPQLVELKVYYRQEEGRGNKIDLDSLNLTLHLHTTKLGMVEIEVGLYRGTVNIDFRLEDEYRMRFLKGEAPSLQEALLAEGFGIGWHTFSVRDDKLDQEDQTSLERLSRIDFRV